MTSAEHPRREVSIAGVPWPLHKLVALAAGLAVLIVVAVLTASAAPAVLAGAATGTVLWLAPGLTHPSRR